MKSTTLPRTPARLRLAGTFTAVALLSACGGGGSGPAPAPGQLRLALTDAPGCGFDHVYVTLEKVRVHASAAAQDTDGGWTDIPLAGNRRVDLLALTNGALEELGSAQVPSGRYQQLRLVLAPNQPGADAMPNAVLATGAAAETPLELPADRSVKIPAAIDVAASGTADFVLDFDACRSVAPAGAGSWRLKPVISVVPRRAAGIDGVVAPALAGGSTIVSAQRDGMAVRETRPDAGGKFSIPYLQPGTYTLVITAEGRATGVVTDVPVGDGLTTVSQAATAISLPPSATKTIDGTVKFEWADAAGAGPSAFTEGVVRAAQQLAGGRSVEVRARPLDAVGGTYRLTLPANAPVRAAYAPSGALAFQPDATEAGRYSVDVLVSGDEGAAD